MAKARISIPKPPIREIPNYDNEVSHSFKRSSGFIKYIPMTIQEEQNKVEYNLDRADVVMDCLYSNNIDMASETQTVW